MIYLLFQTFTSVSTNIQFKVIYKKKGLQHNNSSKINTMRLDFNKKNKMLKYIM